MQFACIRDCSVCPFGCYRQSSRGQAVQVVRSNPIPEVIQKSEIVTEEPEKEEVLSVPESVIPVEQAEEKENNAIQEAQNLPVLSEVQFEVFDDNRKGLKRLFKR